MNFKKTFLLLLSLLIFSSCYKVGERSFDPVEVEKERILKLAEEYINAKPITVTDSTSERSAGGIHDFYSEGDYWWPDPDNPDGPYIRRDGMTNPDNFTAHRKAMIRLNLISGALTSAYLITGEKKYLQNLVPHLTAWFVNEETKMNPSLLYAQAIKGKVTGRGIGIIDTVHLIEVAKSVEVMQRAGILSEDNFTTIREWFKQYLEWITTHPFGIAERDNGNNHSVTWAEQVAAFAHLVDDEKQLQLCRRFYKETLLPQQMDQKGAFPLELARTKPYGYSIFVLDAMTTLCQILSVPEDNLFEYQTEDGKSIALGIEFLYPYLKNKEQWPYQQDVMYWEEWPVRQPSLLFGGLALEKEKYLELWKDLEADYSNPEVIRNMPVKFPLLWLDKNHINN